MAPRCQKAQGNPSCCLFQHLQASYRQRLGPEAPGSCSPWAAPALRSRGNGWYCSSPLVPVARGASTGPFPSLPVTGGVWVAINFIVGLAGTSPGVWQRPKPRGSTGLLLTAGCNVGLPLKLPELRLSRSGFVPFPSFGVHAVAK